MSTKVKNINSIKVRESNFELLRIFSILAIICSHFFTHSFDASIITTDFNLNVLLKGLLTFGCVANFIFIALTGYFMVKSKPNYKKIVGLVLEMYFYSLLIPIFALLTNHQLTFSHIRDALLPFPFGNWFCVMYIVLYLFIPVINRLINTLDKNDFRKLILLCFIVFSIVPTVFLRNPNFSNLTIFILDYLIGAYISLYSINLSKKKRLRSTILSITLLLLSVIAIYLVGITLNIGIMARSATYLISSNHSPLVIFAGTMVFLAFKDLRIKPSRLINTIALSTLGIYLIHDNRIIRHMIWKEIIPVNLMEADTVMLLGTCAVKVLLVFIICLAIDQLRILLFGKLEKQLSEKIYNLGVKTNALIKTRTK